MDGRKSIPAIFDDPVILSTLAAIADHADAVVEELLLALAVWVRVNSFRV